MSKSTSGCGVEGWDCGLATVLPPVTGGRENRAAIGNILVLLAVPEPKKTNRTYERWMSAGILCSAAFLSSCFGLKSVCRNWKATCIPCVHVFQELIWVLGPHNLPNQMFASQDRKSSDVPPNAAYLFCCRPAEMDQAMGYFAFCGRTKSRDLACATPLRTMSRSHSCS